MNGIALKGLTTRPAQAWGGVRLVPLVRDSPIEDLRLDPRIYSAYGVVDVGVRMTYSTYIPHGFVATWTSDGSPAATYGTQLRAPGTPERPPAHMPLRFHHRMARRTDKNRLRFLPLHLALEGYLTLHFGGPEIMWEEWSHRAVRQGLSPRVEEAYSGAAITGLEEALRVFEIHHGQCGVLVYVADALAAAFVVPHPADYRVLHTTLVNDLYGELIYHYGVLSPPVPDFHARLDDTRIRSLADLRSQAREQQEAWARFHDRLMAGALLDGVYTSGTVYDLGPYRLSRLLPSFERRRENHLAETITDSSGTLAYLKTFRLSENQVRRGHLLSTLAAADWHLADTATALGITLPALVHRIESAGFASLLRQDVRDRYRNPAPETAAHRP
ncbi:ARPP-2 domain-containing protein [Actinocorallia populi]|uniref:ARPP-2 domain-containing protein n=1 Tax=Actinocorallia populi TaxID=2079200 RepID=UPI000D08C2A5|nr:hypothetical protein [Actinocorallia populi]